MTGTCSSCGKEILVKVNGKFRKSLAYREHFLELSNGTIMRVGVCEDCKIKLVTGDKVDETAEKILDNHKIYWKEHSDTAPAKYDEITVTNPNTTPSQFIRSRNIDRHLFLTEK